MKKMILYLGMFFLLGIAFTGCYHDVILPDSVVDPDGPPQAVSFKNDIAPMVNTKCAISGCHVSGAHKPNMTIGGSYQEIANGGFVNTVIPKESIIYKMINGGMQQYITSATDRQKIYDWIRNGAPNN
ncbi:MAG: hypothetical protein ABIS69_08750 [Sediminibacterium sp.]